MYIKKFILILLGFFTLSLGGALILEYVFKVQPCSLCIYQRYLCLFNFFILGLLYIFYHKITPKLAIKIIFISLFLPLILSLVHVLVEHKIVILDSVCKQSVNFKNITSQADLLKALPQKPVSCAHVAFKFLGLSLAEINSVLLFVIIIIFKTLNIFKKP